MAEVKLYNLSGKEVGVMPLPDSLFAVTIKPAVVHEVIVAQEANARTPDAHTKDRSEVSGGGKKPWKQKGTGRARHGSTRSPIWVGGGVAHGPRNDRSFAVKVNKKMKRTAIAMLLSDRLADGQFVAVDSLQLPEAKTKLVATALRTLRPEAKKVLVLTTGEDAAFIQAARNMPSTMTMAAHSVNPRDLALYPSVVASKAAIDTLITTFSA